MAQAFGFSPATLAQANKMVSQLHRHHKPCVGHRFSLALSLDDKVVGVVICGRPVARMEDPYKVLEISRCCTDGTPNAISKLYPQVFRIAALMGFDRVQTYTLPEEGGASMRAVGMTLASTSPGGQWKHTDGKARRTDQPTSPKSKWVKELK